ncbi:MAG: hypothetical protein ACYTF5_06180 [Planctomycetota bacterium]
MLMLATPLSAQVASYTYIDQKAPYKNQNPPMLTALNLPKIGTTFQVRVPDSTVFSHSTLAFGVSNPNLPIPGLGGYLFTSAEIVMWTSKSSGVFSVMTTMSFPIPNSPQLLGVRFSQQVLRITYCPFQACYGASLSRGGYGVIGK